jgi:hypothetical protein
MKLELGMVIASKAPKAKPEHVQQLIAELRKAGKPLLAAELAEIIFGKATETAKRRIRSIAAAARWRVISSPGSDGYDLLARCKIDDAWHNVYAMEAAGQALLKDALALRRALHSGYRGEPGDNGQEQLAI